ncbi:MAG: UbiA prenyltransferase family protein [Bacteroidetes bacterium]|nr:UbiA prenyltransferase family protein [Bacteroidota bacterium]MBL0095763.1 UbiA prenyltransferase family protein [Bacteroidota bacterium]
MKNEKLKERTTIYYAVLMAMSATLMGLKFFPAANGLHSTSDIYLHGLLLFSGTFLAYSISFPSPFLDISRGKFKHRKINLLILISFLLCITLPFFLFIPPGYMIQYGLAGLLSLFYYTGFSAKKIRFGGARTVFLLKNIVLALAWAFATSPISLEETDSVFLFFNRFLFVMALSLVIDIRDITSDGQKRIITIPAKAGILPTKIISGILLIAGTAFTLKSHQTGFIPLSIFTASAISTLSTIIAIAFVQKKSSSLLFLLLVDGNLLLHGILFSLSNNN